MYVIRRLSAEGHMAIIKRRNRQRSGVADAPAERKHLRRHVNADTLHDARNLFDSAKYRRCLALRSGGDQQRSLWRPEERLLPYHQSHRAGGANFLQQRARFDEFNTERPHQEALAMACSAEHYSPSPRPLSGPARDRLPFPRRGAIVTTCGRICYKRKKINLSQVFAGQTVGVKQVDDRIWLASFMD